MVLKSVYSSSIKLINARNSGKKYRVVILRILRSSETYDFRLSPLWLRRLPPFASFSFFLTHSSALKMMEICLSGLFFSVFCCLDSGLTTD
jgi:hypothetical protein